MLLTPPSMNFHLKLPLLWIASCVGAFASQAEEPPEVTRRQAIETAVAYQQFA